MGSDSEAMSTATERAYTHPEPEAILPNRSRDSLAHTIDDVMPDEFLRDLGAFLDANRTLFTRGGDPDGHSRYNFELCDLDQFAPDLVREFRKHILKRYTEALKPCCVPEFDLRYFECHATLYHHGSHFTWHDDAPGYDGKLVDSRRLTFVYYMHTKPKMFSGGELEFLDGRAIEPKNNRAAFFHPIQQHRIRTVECWSHDFMHGRWALMGWLHGDPPPGWVEKIPALRGKPHLG